MDIILILSYILLWLGVALNWGVFIHSFVQLRKRGKQYSKVIQDLDYALQQRIQTASELQEIKKIKENLLYYCQKCKQLIKLKQ